MEMRLAVGFLVAPVWWWSGATGLGLLQGLVGGAFGIGGSSIGTPLLRLLLGTPPLVALGTPLPLTVPTAAAGTVIYHRHGMVNWRAVRWTVPLATPAAAAGAVCTRWAPVDLVMLLVATAMLLSAAQLWRSAAALTCSAVRGGGTWHGAPVWLLVAMGAGVGFVSGLLANAGGFLLVPLYVWMLGARVRQAAATSLACAPFIALPGLVVHGMLGHIDPILALQMGIGSVVGSLLGARLSLRFERWRLRQPFAVLLLAFGLYFAVRVAGRGA